MNFVPANNENTKDVVILESHEYTIHCSYGLCDMQLTQKSPVVRDREYMVGLAGNMGWHVSSNRKIYCPKCTSFFEEV